jgi:hypothetical protein
MPKRHTVRGLVIPLLATALLLAGHLPATASFQSTSDAAVYPLAICRDGISFLFLADYYPAGTGDPDEEHVPVRVLSVQAATPVPPADANGRITPPADTLVLDTTLNVPYAPSSSTWPPLTRRRGSPSTRRTSPCPGPTPSRWASRTSPMPVARTRCAGTAGSRRGRSRWG